ncbi:MAG: hypothetical protein IT371_05810 [Deltaproteobacteria bacterium]|nr:hypothetical protein [Deltaproteobacteria bacterium]
MRAIVRVALATSLGLFPLVHGTGCGPEGSEGSGSERAAQGGAKDKVREALRRAAEDQDRLFALGSRGSVRKQRLYVSRAKTPEARELVATINETLRGVQTALRDALAAHRREPGEPVELARSDYQAYNAFLPGLDTVRLVYDGDAMFAAFAADVPIRAADLVAVELSAFDFVEGFAGECRKEWRSGLIAYRNPRTGEISWHKAWRSSIAVVGVKADGSPILESKWRTGLSSALDPVTRRWEVHGGGWSNPSASVYDPDQERVIHRDGGWKTGIGGVFNPVTGQIEWQSSWKTGHAGYFDPRSQRVVWTSEWKSGVACIWRLGDEFFTSNGGPGLEDDDD